jgi:predicted ATPase
MQLQPGATVDRYVVEGTLGSGGMAEVYAVRHVTLGMSAALKVLRIRSAQLAGRLLREGRAQARLQHPNVVRVLDLLEVDGAPALLMERVEGPTLAQIIAQGPLPIPRLDRLVRGIMLGLHAAHLQGIVHRDLKPSNVIVAAGDVPRIADFGLATALLDETDHAITRPGTAIGTPAYMAPEQHEDSHLVDARADIFALGVVMYELVAGQAPAAGGNLLAAWQKMSNKRWRRLSELVPGLPERIDQAVCWALEPDRDQRAPGVAALWERWFEEPFPASGFEIERPEQVTVELAAVPLARVAPSPISAIPRALRTLVGREGELEALREALEPRGGLATLVGTAGVGKTRLAVALAEEWRAARKPSLWVDLQAARDEQDVLRLVSWLLEDAGRALGLGQVEASAAGIGRALGRSGALLLVLDNFEQLLGDRLSAEMVGLWVAMCPSLRVLVTSRQPLGQGGEVLLGVSPLPLPDAPHEVLRCAAWELFAAAAPPGALEHVDMHRMAALLRALDGLPLALELAAARLEVLALDELEQRLLPQRFGVLVSPETAGRPGHHRALYDAIAWSWSLLRPPEQQAFAQLAAFVSPFSLEAAEAVLEAGEPVLDLLHSLIRRSLVRRTGARFHLLLSVREFAAQQLEADPRAGAWRRHARYFASRAAEWLQPGARGTERTMREISEAIDELGVTIERAAQQEDLVEDALGCANARGMALERRGPLQAILRMGEAALRLRAPTEAARSHQLSLRARCALAWRWTGRIEESRAELQIVLASAPPPALEALALARLADLADPEEALPLYERALALAEAHGPPDLRMTVPAALATIMAVLGKREEVDRWMQRAMASLDPRDELAALEVQKARGYVALHRADHDEAFAAHTQVRDLSAARGYRRGMFNATGQLGLVAEARGQLPQAEQLLGEASAGVAEEGDSIYAAIWRGFRGRVLARMGRTSEAYEELTAVLREDAGMDVGMRSLMALIAALVACKEDPGSAASWTEQAAHASGAARAVPAPLAQGFLAARRGDRPEIARAVRELRPAVEAVKDLGVKALARGLLEELSGLAAAWRVARDGSWVDPPDGPRIELHRHAANARIVAFLAQRRAEDPEVATDAIGLAGAGWPGERIVAAAAANRVRVALSTLRRMGLADLIERVEGGWRLGADQQVQIAEP